MKAGDLRFLISDLRKTSATIRGRHQASGKREYPGLHKIWWIEARNVPEKNAKVMITTTKYTFKLNLLITLPLLS